MSDKVFRIVVSDRSSNVRKFLRREFLSQGYQVSSAKDAEQILLALASPAPPDLLLIDMQLSGCDTSDFWEQIMQSPTAPFIIVHAFSQDILPDRLQGKVARVNKTGDLESLARAVSWCLSQKSRLIFSS